MDATGYLSLRILLPSGGNLKAPLLVAISGLLSWSSSAISSSADTPTVPGYRRQPTATKYLIPPHTAFRLCFRCGAGCFLDMSLL